MDRFAEFEALIRRICDRETSLCPDSWTRHNPLLGQGAVVALLAHELFGGFILKASLMRTPFAEIGYHYWNRISSGERIDFTEGQFGRRLLRLDGDPKRPEMVLCDKSIEERYKLLRSRAEAAGWFEMIGREGAAPIFAN
jgi:hypothetical protein